MTPVPRGHEFGFYHALQPPFPPVVPDPWFCGHIPLLVLTPVISLYGLSKMHTIKNLIRHIIILYPPFTFPFILLLT